MISIFKRKCFKDRKYYNIIYSLFGITPNNIEIYKLALIHRSASIIYEDNECFNNERLEFLGDAILQAVSSEMLFVNFNSYNEGELTKLRSKLVDRVMLKEIALKLKLNKYIVTNPPQLATKQQDICGNALEALIGAIHLDKGYNKAAQIIIKLINEQRDIQEIDTTENNFKSIVIEYAQKQNEQIEFDTYKIEEHKMDNEVLFETKLYINDEIVARGEGRSKKIAEQNAAKQLSEILNDI